MIFYRLIKPIWAQKVLANNKPNPEFIKDIPGNKNILEGCFTHEFVKQKNSEGYNIYWFPNCPKEDVYQQGTLFLNGKNISNFRYVFVDMDLKDGQYASKIDFIKKVCEFPVKPTMVVNSGNGVHVYWRMENLTREEYLIAQFGLLNYFKTDESVWTVLQLMRYPGSYNTKDVNNFKEVQLLVEISSNNTYKDISVFPKEVLQISETAKNKARLHLAKLDGKVQIELSGEIDFDKLPPKFLTLMEQDHKIKELFEDPYSFNGDRSSADMSLANRIYAKGLNKEEAVQVLSNTRKALSKGSYRTEYAVNTVAKVYAESNMAPLKSRPEDNIQASPPAPSKFRSVAEIIQSKDKELSGTPIYGPEFLDYKALVKTWRTSQIVELIAGTGVGKTAFTLFLYKEMLKNNPNTDGIFAFFSLEMPEREIAERWRDLVGQDSPWSNKLYIIGNEDPETGDPRNLGLQEIVEYCQELEKQTGKKLISIGIDHFGLMANHIDTRKKYTFGILSEKAAGFGPIRTISPDHKAKQLKSVAKMLDVFLIILSQTTKDKGVGDLPIKKDGTYGTSELENISDYVISIWQPLMRVHKDLTYRCLAYWYAKIRNKDRKDNIHELDQKLLTYNPENGDLTYPTHEEFTLFKEWLPKAVEARKNETNKKAGEYTRTMSLDAVKDAVNKFYNQN